MSVRIASTAALAAISCGMLPAWAADPQLLGLVMPDAKIVAGVNVEQAKPTPFGQYILAQVTQLDAAMQGLVTMTGFDPRRDVRELLAASNGSAGSGIVLARGVFDISKVAAAAAVSGAKSEVYGGVTILEDPKQTAAIAFLDSSVAVIGPPQLVKLAIDRRSTPTSLPAGLSSQITQWSLSQDAWVVSVLPPSSLKAQGAASQIPGLSQLASSNLMQQAAAGLKFGPTIQITAQAQADTAQNAASLVGVIQFLQNLARAQAGQDPQAAALLDSIAVSSQGAIVKLSMSLSEAQVEDLMKPKPAASGAGSPATPPGTPAKSGAGAPRPTGPPVENRSYFPCPGLRAHSTPVENAMIRGACIESRSALQAIPEKLH